MSDESITSLSNGSKIVSSSASSTSNGTNGTNGPMPPKGEANDNDDQNGRNFKKNRQTAPVMDTNRKEGIRDSEIKVMS